MPGRASGISDQRMFDKILIANRGEIACRVIKTARRMGNRPSPPFPTPTPRCCMRMADEALHIGPPPASQSYIVIDRILDAAKASGAQAIVSDGFRLAQAQALLWKAPAS